MILPTVTKAGFKGVGSTQGEQTFDMNILCNGGINPTGYEEKNLILEKKIRPEYTREKSYTYNNINKVAGKGDYGIA